MENHHDTWYTDQDLCVFVSKQVAFADKSCARRSGAFNFILFLHFFTFLFTHGENPGCKNICRQDTSPVLVPMYSKPRGPISTRYIDCSLIDRKPLLESFCQSSTLFNNISNVITFSVTTALMWAIQLGQLDSVTKLLKSIQPSDLDAMDSEGNIAYEFSKSRRR